MFDFTYHTPTEVVFGRGAENRTGALLKARGEHVCFAESLTGLSKKLG